jgi:hypothetical protein
VFRIRYGFHKHKEPGFVFALKFDFENRFMYFLNEFFGLYICCYIQDPNQCGSGTKTKIYWQWSGSEIFIPDPNFFHLGSRIRNFFYPKSRIRIKEFKLFNPTNLFLSSQKHDRGCSSRIRILIFYPSRIQGVKKAPYPGSATLFINVTLARGGVRQEVW